MLGFIMHLKTAQQGADCEELVIEATAVCRGVVKALDIHEKQCNLQKYESKGKGRITREVNLSGVTLNRVAGSFFGGVREFFRWSRIPNNFGNRIRIFLSDTDSGSLT